MKWIKAKEFALVTGLSGRGAREALKKKRWKKQPLVVKQDNSKRGKPAYLVLWNTTTNQPAKQEEIGENDANLHISREFLPATTERMERTLVDSRNNAETTTASERKNSALPKSSTATKGVDLNAPTSSYAVPSTVDSGNTESSHFFSKEKENSNVNHPNQLNVISLPQKPKTASQSQSNTLPNAGTIKTLLPESLENEEKTTVLCEQSSDLNPAVSFDDLLYRHLLSKSPASRKALKSKYKKIYRETSEIPAVLLGQEKRGRKSNLPKKIKQRFIELIQNSVIPLHPEFHTRDTRKITTFHTTLEKEFKQTIQINSLYQIVKSSRTLKSLINKADDENSEEKPASFFKKEAVGALMQMDGVITDYLTVKGENGKQFTPVYIEFFDLGSRKLMAMKAYKSESSESSVDIFTEFLKSSLFAAKKMKIRPDNAAGFLNLRRPIKELNNKHATRDGFAFIDDYARAGAPKDKAHLESSHRAFHRFEQQIINHFKDKIINRELKNKKIGNRFVPMTITHLNITLDELNACGMTQEYLHQHNSKPHRFTENGEQKRWIPDTRWKQYINENEENLIHFSQADIDLCRIYGYPKQRATISKDGVITYKKKRYNVEDKTLWTRQSSTKVAISLIESETPFIAIFKDEKEGIFLGKGIAQAAPTHSEKRIEKEKAKVEKIHLDNENAALHKAVNEVCLMINVDQLEEAMRSSNLNNQEVLTYLNENKEDIQKSPQKVARFFTLISGLKKIAPVRVVPNYADNTKKA